MAQSLNTCYPHYIPVSANNNRLTVYHYFYQKLTRTMSGTCLLYYCSWLQRKARMRSVCRTVRREIWCQQGNVVRRVQLIFDKKPKEMCQILALRVYMCAIFVEHFPQVVSPFRACRSVLVCNFILQFIVQDGCYINWYYVFHCIH